MPLTPKDMIKHLKKNGFEVVSQRGSHVKMRNMATGKQTEVPMHNKDLGKGLESEILKQAGLK
jgi:predicted RNA binding protein YcfA (HicA-like mRNA interferase family)